MGHATFLYFVGSSKIFDFRKSMAFMSGNESIENNKMELQLDQHAHWTLNLVFNDQSSFVHFSVDQILYEHSF